MIGLAPLPSRERLLFGWAIAGLGAVAAVLVWTLWAKGASPALGTAECPATGLAGLGAVKNTAWQSGLG